MNKLALTLSALLAAAMLAGCAADDSDYYLKDSFNYKQVCLVDNRNVDPAFFIALHKAISDKGFKVEIIPSSKAASEAKCPATVLYEAKYNTSGAYKYLEDARLILMHPGSDSDIVTLKKVDKPVFLLDKMADSEPAIRDMVNRLFPRSTPW